MSQCRELQLVFISVIFRMLMICRDLLFKNHEFLNFIGSVRFLVSGSQSSLHSCSRFYFVTSCRVAKTASCCRDLGEGASKASTRV